MTIRLATLRTAEGTTAARIEGDTAVDLGFADVGALLADPGWRTLAAGDGRRFPLDEGDLALVLPSPEKVICVGLNYRSHILEMGRPLPTHPTLFAKYRRALVGPRDPVVVPASSSRMDWEAELGVVIGAPVRHADPATAARAIAGYTVVNDVTARDLQERTLQWLQGKTLESSTPVGPWLMVPEPGEQPTFTVVCELDGEEVQRGDTSDLVFGPAELVAYISSIITLVPGDLISTGTPGGVGHARTPPRYLQPGSLLTTRIEGIGECRNRCVAEATLGA